MRFIYFRQRRRFRIKPGAPLTFKEKRLARVFVVLLVLLIISGLFAGRFRRLIEELAARQVSTQVTYIINAAISEKMTDGSLDYGKLITLEKDKEGNVTALITNTAKINLLKTEIINRVIDKVQEEYDSKVNIPLGNLLDNSFFLGRGPKVSVKIVALTGYSADFANDFTAEGINQTKHSIILNVKANVEMLFAGYSSAALVETQVIVAETIIVGSVPNSYVNFDRLPVS